MTSDQQAIHDVHTTWIAAVNAGDLDKLMTMMADDVVYLSPGRQPFGRDEFPEGFKSGHERFHLRCVSELEEIMVAGDMAYTRCRDSLSLVPRERGEPMKLAGHRLTIYRRQADGRWLLARDAHTLTAV